MRTGDFDFDFYLPQSRIAYEPADVRDSSRLMALPRDGAIEHGRFRDLPGYLKKGDMLVLNKAKVFPARLSGIKPTGGRLDVLLVSELGDDEWEILCKKSYTGRLDVADGFYLEISDGHRAKLFVDGDLRERLWQEGEMPLPPYIKRPPGPMDKIRYQTVYAEAEGSIAAPTAGLHFTAELLENIEQMGVSVRYLTLHVGKGTFMPIRAEELAGHAMPGEFFEIEEALIDDIERTRRSGGLVFSVGTTTTRALEGYVSGRYQAAPSSNGRIGGVTDIFIYPPFEFRLIDGLITNFHLPRSTPLMLTAAFAGRERLMEAYREALALGYRFFSYGDAMLVL